MVMTSSGSALSGHVAEASARASRAASAALPTLSRASGPRFSGLQRRIAAPTTFWSKSMLAPVIRPDSSEAR